MSLPPFIGKQALAVSGAIRPEDPVSNISASSWTNVPDPPDAFSWSGSLDQTEEEDLPPGALDFPTVIDLDIVTVQPTAQPEKSAPHEEQEQDTAQSPLPAPNLDPRLLLSLQCQHLQLQLNQRPCSTSGCLQCDSRNRGCSELAGRDQPAVRIQEVEESEAG